MLLSQGRKSFLVCSIGITFLVYLNYFSLLGRLSKWKDYTRVKTWEGLSELQEITSLALKRPNLPVKFWYAHRQFDMKYNDTCALFPDITEIEYVHEYWQLLETPEGNVKLIGAYLDDRPEINTVRLLTMIDKRHPVKMDTWCQFWFHDQRQPVIVPVEEYFYVWNEYWYQKPDGEFQPYLLSCKLPPELSFAVPSSVSLVKNFCDDASNSLKVIYEKPEKKKGFAVCTKGVNFVNDITVRLVEWIEFMVLLGVEKIYMFDIYANPQVQKLYEYYTDKGILEVTPLMLPQVQLNEPFIQHMFLEHDANMQAEVIPYNHCFLSHMYEYEYIGVMDTDEVIVPKGGMTSLRDLVNTAQKRATSENLSPGSFIARNCYFFDNATINNMKPHFPKDVYEDIHRNIDDLDIPAYMHMSQRLFKSKNCTGPGMYIKSLHSTEAVVAVHNHYHFKVLDPKYINYDLNFDEGFMHHYRNGCPGEMKPVCYSDYQSDFEYDDSILQYYDRLKENVIRVLDDLGYF